MSDISVYAFAGCCNLTSITIPDRVTSIGEYAFLRCSSLENIIIPSSVTTIRTSAFLGCSNLETFSVSSNNSNYASDLGILFNKNKTSLLRCPEKMDNSNIASCINKNPTITEIGENAFYGCTQLKNILIPSTVTKIGASVFEGCKELENILIPESVKIFGKDSTGKISKTFYNFKNLKNVAILSSQITSLGTGVFGGDTNDDKAIVTVYVPK